MRITFIKSKKEFDIDFWQTLFCRIWAYLAPILGVLNVYTILNYAIGRCKEKHRILDGVKIITDGIDLDFLKKEIMGKKIKDEDAIFALHDFLSEILSALAILSGRKVSREVRNFLNKISKQEGLKNKVICLPNPREEETTCFSFDF